MATYRRAVCGALALNTNSVVTDGQVIHRACATPRPGGVRHAGHCSGDPDCRGECVGEPGDYADTAGPHQPRHDYTDPLQDREPMGGDPLWRQDP